MAGKQMGRLAMREEGVMWNAYYALPDSMEGAILIGSIALRAVHGAKNMVRKRAFMAMMRGLVSDLLKDTTGERPDWRDPVNAPAHERAKR